MALFDSNSFGTPAGGLLGNLPPWMTLQSPGDSVLPPWLQAALTQPNATQVQGFPSQQQQPAALPPNAQQAGPAQMPMGEPRRSMWTPADAPDDSPPVNPNAPASAMRGPMLGAPQPQQAPGMSAVAQGQPSMAQAPQSAPPMGGGIGNPVTGLMDMLWGGGDKRAGTSAALAKLGIDPQVAQAMARDKNLMALVAPSLIGGGGTADIKEFEYAKKQGFKGTFEDWMQRKKAVSGEYGMTPIWGTGPDDQPAVLQLGKSGDAKQSVLPPGFKLARDPVKIEGPTGTVILDPQTRQQVGFIPKDVQGAAAAGQRGDVQGKAQANLPITMERSIKTVEQIDELLEHKGLSAIVGPIDQFRPSWTMGAEGTDALARYNQLKGKAFLEAFGMLKGGGAVTEMEGAKASDAMARMDRSQSEAEFKTALKDFRDAVRDGAKKIQMQANGNFSGSAPSTSTSKTIKIDVNGNIIP